MTTQPHDEDSRTCWCNPRLAIVCDACDEHPDPLPDCWKCQGEGVVDKPATIGPDEPVIIIHREA